MLFRKTAVSVSAMQPQFDQLIPRPCQINGRPLARPTKCRPVAGMPRPRASQVDFACYGRNQLFRTWVWIARKETALAGRPPKSGRIFHYTSINLWICSAIKCAGYDSRKVESANATIDGGWAKIPIGHTRIHYEAAHLCAEEPHL
jgi:hypothetical protein